MSNEVRAMPNVEYGPDYGGDGRAVTMPFAIWETLTPHAKHLCRRVACAKGQRLQNRFGEELPDEIVGKLTALEAKQRDVSLELKEIWEEIRALRENTPGETMAFGLNDSISSSMLSVSTKEQVLTVKSGPNSDFTRGGPDILRFFSLVSDS